MIILSTDEEIQLKFIAQEAHGQRVVELVSTFPLGLKLIFMDGQNKGQPKSLYRKKLRNWEILFYLIFGLCLLVVQVKLFYPNKESTKYNDMNKNGFSYIQWGESRASRKILTTSIHGFHKQFQGAASVGPTCQAVRKESTGRIRVVSPLQGV